MALWTTLLILLFTKPDPLNIASILDDEDSDGDFDMSHCNNHNTNTNAIDNDMAALIAMNRRLRLLAVSDHDSDEEHSNANEPEPLAAFDSRMQRVDRKIDAKRYEDKVGKGGYNGDKVMYSLVTMLSNSAENYDSFIGQMCNFMGDKSMYFMFDPCTHSLILTFDIAIVPARMKDSSKLNLNAARLGPFLIEAQFQRYEKRAQGDKAVIKTLNSHFWRVMRDWHYFTFIVSASAINQVIISVILSDVKPSDFAIVIAKAWRRAARNGKNAITHDTVLDNNAICWNYLIFDNCAKGNKCKKFHDCGHDKEHTILTCPDFEISAVNVRLFKANLAFNKLFYIFVLGIFQKFFLEFS